MMLIPTLAIKIRLAHLGHGENKVHGRMLRVDAFQLHPLLEAALHCWHSLGLDTWDTKAQMSVQPRDAD